MNNRRLRKPLSLLVTLCLIIGMAPLAGISARAAGEPTIAITLTGLSDLKAGRPIAEGSAYVVYTLTDGEYAASIAATSFAITGLPAELTAGTATRTSPAVVTVPISGTPTAASASGFYLVYPATIPKANVDAAEDDVVATPAASALAAIQVAKGDGAAVSGAPAVSTGYPTADSIAVNAVTIPTNPGTQTVEYAISTSDGAPADPGSWQAGRTFSGLTSGTSYYIFARSSANANYNAGAPQSVGPITTATPYIAVASTGLADLKVGQAASGSVRYTLTNSEYADTITPGDFAVGGLPPGLSSGTVTRTSATVVTVSVTGTPTTANADPTTLTIPPSIPQSNVKGAAGAIAPTGTATTGPVAKGTGAALSGVPTVNGAPTDSSIAVNAVTIPTNPGGQVVEYAIGTLATVVPASGWEVGKTEFTGLDSGTRYYVFARAKENGNYEAGTARVSSAISTLNNLSGDRTISIVAPVTGATPQATISAGTGAGYTGAISWYLVTGGTDQAHTGPFAPEKVYKASVTLTSTAGYQWPSAAPTIIVPAGGTVVVTGVNGTGPGNTLSFEVTFPATPGLPYIVATVTGLDGLKVGEPATGVVTFELFNASYNTAINAGHFIVTGLPQGLIASSATRASATAVTVQITGTPTSYDMSSKSIIIPASVAQTNVQYATASIAVTIPGGELTAGPVAKGAGAAVSGAPEASGPPTISSITVSPVTVEPPNTGSQLVEYAINTTAAAPETGWQGAATFINLTPGATYYVFARAAAGANYAAGEPRMSAPIHTPSVTAVVVIPPATGVSRGGIKIFTATVSGANDPAQTVSWSVEGAESAETRIDAAGVLKVGDDETATQLTVKATSAADPAMSGSATVAIITAPQKATVSPEHVIFPAVLILPPDYGYAAGDAQILITNIGTATITSLEAVLLLGTASSGFRITAAPQTEIDPSGAAIMRVSPKPGLPAGTYTDTLLIMGDDYLNLYVTLEFTVSDVPVTGISLNPAGGKDFGYALLGYGAVAAHSVTVNNTGNLPTGPLTAQLSGAGASAFSMTTAGMTGIPVGGSGAITVAPKTGLGLGTYTATVTISGDNGIYETFDVSFTVNSVTSYRASIDPKSRTYPTAVQGYNNSGLTQEFTITNTGTERITGLSATIGGTDAYEYTTYLSSLTIEPGASVTIGVRPRAWLVARAAAYTGSLNITGDNGISLSVPLSFTVTNTGAVQYGNLKGYGNVDISDLVLMLRFFANRITADDIVYRNADVNGDGRVNNADMIMLLRYFARPGTVLGPG